MEWSKSGTGESGSCHWFDVDVDVPDVDREAEDEEAAVAWAAGTPDTGKSEVGEPLEEKGRGGSV